MAETEVGYASAAQRRPRLAGTTVSEAAGGLVLIRRTPMVSSAWSGTISFGITSIPAEAVHRRAPQGRVVPPARRPQPGPDPLPEGVRGRRRGRPARPSSRASRSPRDRHVLVDPDELAPFVPLAPKPMLVIADRAADYSSSLATDLRYARGRPPGRAVEDPSPHADGRSGGGEPNRSPSNPPAKRDTTAGRMS